MNHIVFSKTENVDTVLPLCLILKDWLNKRHLDPHVCLCLRSVVTAHVSLGNSTVHS